MVRAKFRVVLKREADGSQLIKLEPVGKTNSPKDENSKFFKYTPGGSIDLYCCNPDAVRQFEVGKEYYVDFTPAP